MDENQPVDLRAQADFAQAKPRSGRRWLVRGAIAMVVVAGVAFGIWYAVTPHSAAQQLEKARKLDKRFRTEGNQLPAEDRQKLLDKTVEAYQRVYEKFTATDDEAATAHEGLAKLYESEKDFEQAWQWYQRIIDQYKSTPHARRAHAALWDGYREQGRQLDATDRQAALMWYDKAAETIESFCIVYGPDEPAVPEAAWQRCEIIDKDIREPISRAIEAYEKYINDFGSRRELSERIGDAMFRLAQLYELDKQYRLAVETYEKFINEHPTHPRLKQAEIGRARNLSQYDGDAAQKAWEELARKYPDDEDVKLAIQELADKLQQTEADEAERQARDYRQQRYGGGGGGGGGGAPVDSGWGKPVPPHEMLKEFIEQKLDAEHYTLKMKIAPADRTLEIEGELKITNGGDDKKDFLLMLGPLMKVDTFTFDGQSVRAERPPGKDEVIRIVLPNAWANGVSATLGFHYTAEVEKLEFPPEMVERAIEEFSLAPWRGITVAAPATTEPDTQPDTRPEESPAPAPSPIDIRRLLTHPGLQIQLNESGYALSGAAWYPLTVFGDLFTADIDIEIVGQQLAVCSGRLVERKTDAGVSTSIWSCEKPLFGLYFCYGDFQVGTRTVDGVEISVYFHPDQAGKIQAYLDAAAKVLQFHVSRFGPFPFEKLALAQVDLPPILGGVGPASMMFLHTLVVQTKTDVPTNLLAHELSHQWWGNLIPINLIDPGYSQWLSEGFATYADAMYTEHAEGEQAFRDHIREMGKLYLEQAAVLRESAVNKTYMGQPMYRVTVYEKGALVLHALRFVLGDEAFFRVLREYTDRYAFKLSTVDDFRKLAAEVAGKNLDWFFNEWLDQPGCPRYVLRKVEASEDGKELRVYIDQPDYLSEMPLEVVAEPANAGAEPVRVRGEVDKKENVVTMSVSGPIERVRLDPDNWVLRRADGDDVYEMPPAP